VMTLAFASGCGASSKYMTKLESPTAVQVNPAAATVFFVRPSSFAASIKATILDSNGQFLGEALPKSYFAVQLPPGEHVFVAWSEGTPALKATLEPGKVYYVEVAPIVGVWSARVRLFAIGPQREQFAKLPSWIAESSMLIPDQATGQAYIQQRLDDAQNTIAKGVSSFSDYDAEDKAKRTLLPSDALPAPIAAH
jgi:hypothetical protein